MFRMQMKTAQGKVTKINSIDFAQVNKFTRKAIVFTCFIIISEMEKNPAQLNNAKRNASIQ